MNSWGPFWITSNCATSCECCFNVFNKPSKLLMDIFLLAAEQPAAAPQTNCGVEVQLKEPEVSKSRHQWRVKLASLPLHK